MRLKENKNHYLNIHRKYYIGKNRPKKWEVKSYKATLGMFFVSLAGFFLLMNELYEIRKQNDSVKISFWESIRPIGIITETPNAFFKSVTSGDTINCITPKILKNKGKGVMLYIGNITFFSDTLLDFVSNSFADILKSGKINIDYLNYDSRYSEQRVFPLLIDESIDFDLAWNKIPNKPPYYFYCIFLYKDSYKNLYDTIFLYYRSKSLPSKEEILEFRPNQYFHSYTNYDQNDLYNFLLDKNRSLAFGIGKR